mgnify:CR=1 FL=1
MPTLMFNDDVTITNYDVTPIDILSQRVCNVLKKWYMANQIYIITHHNTHTLFLSIFAQLDKFIAMSLLYCT